MFTFGKLWLTAACVGAEAILFGESMLKCPGGETLENLGLQHS